MTRVRPVPGMLYFVVSSGRVASGGGAVVVAAGRDPDEALDPGTWLWSAATGGTRQVDGFRGGLLAAWVAWRPGDGKPAPGDR